MYSLTTESPVAEKPQGGKPFFYVDRPVDDGLLGALRTEIVPRLLRDVPRQTSSDELKADKRLHRFRLVFDRAGCSFRVMAEMWTGFRIPWPNPA